jgi:predicted DNA-binding transcriptional regulator AlpA
MTETPQLLTPSEAAAALRISRETLWRYWRRGQLDRVEINGRVHRYTRASIERLIDSATRHGASEPSQNNVSHAGNVADGKASDGSARDKS